MGSGAMCEGSRALDRNYELFFAFLERHLGDAASARILDYGCGDGALIEEGRRRGYDMVGAENYYGDSDARPRSAHVRLLEPDGAIPWEDRTFDAIVSNQVLEHVEHLERAAGEMRRVAKPAAVMLHVFPTRSQAVESHLGLPFVHWLPPSSRIRFQYARALRRMGLGFDHWSSGPSDEWSARALAWMDEHVFYRSWREIKRIFRTGWEVRSYTLPQLEWLLQPKSGFAAGATRVALRSGAGRVALERAQWLRIGHALLCSEKSATGER